MIKALVGLTRTPATFAVGISSRSSSSRFGASSVFMLVTPVTLPPGRSNLGQIPPRLGRYSTGIRWELLRSLPLPQVLRAYFRAQPLCSLEAN